MDEDKISKKLATLITLIILFPTYFILKVSLISKYAAIITLVLAITIPIILHWINKKFS